MAPLVTNTLTWLTVIRRNFTGFEDTEFDQILASEDVGQARVVDVFAALDVQRLKRRLTPAWDDFENGRRAVLLHREFFQVMQILESL